jgi:hypothetical protein
VISGPALGSWRRSRALVAALVLAAAVPSAAYVLPVSGILRRLGEKRAALSLDSLEVTGTLQAEGRAADRLAAAAGLPPAPRLSLPARLLVKVPGRCRLEIGGVDAPEAGRSYAALRDARLTGREGLEGTPAVAGLLRALCALLAVPSAGDPSGAYAAALGRRGVALGDASLGRFEGRVAYVVGGRPRDERPLAWVDKETFQPLRLVAPEGGSLLDVRLLGWGSPTGGDWFPRAVEVWEGKELRLRFTTEKASANPKLPDLLFP